MTARTPIHRSSGPMFALAIVLAAAVSAGTQTKITAPKNSYSPNDDVKLGLEAAAEAKKELPLLNDERLDQYVENVGGKLVAAIPPEFQHSEFKFTFDVVNQKEINAFALPGGPMFLNRGMMEAAKSEAEMAGVMAHEISHVALRHGTAQATKTQKWQIGSAIGQIAGAVLGGGLGSAIGTASQVVPGVYVLKYSREFESQADILGAQILARAGYEPREMANMFKTIQEEGGSQGPEWLSSHPDPGNRYSAINKEAESLRVQGRGETGQFSSMQARLKDMGPSYTAEDIAKGRAPTSNGGNTRTSRTSTGTHTAVKVDPPSAQLRTYTPAEFLRVGVPSNWSPVSDRNGATYVPQGAFFQGQNGATSFTHGIQFGVTQGTGDLQHDTQSLLQAFARNNPDLKLRGGAVRDTVDGRQALTTTLTNVSDVTGAPEQIALTTTLLPNNNMMFIIGVSPQTEASTYSGAFQRIRQSVKINTR